MNAMRRKALISLTWLGAGGWARATSTSIAPHSGAADAALLGPASETLSAQTLAGRLQVGDMVFIRIAARPFREVADATGSWTNHVGIVMASGTADPSMAESTFPLSRTTTWQAFVARSDGARVAVVRPRVALDPMQQAALQQAVTRRTGVRYDTGFDLHSRGQFCSRFVREVLLEATGRAVGEVETFATLLARRPDANLPFWRAWFFGAIPWQRETVTPASVMASPHGVVVFDGVAPVR